MSASSPQLRGGDPSPSRSRERLAPRGSCPCGRRVGQRAIGSDAATMIARHPTKHDEARASQCALMRETVAVQDERTIGSAPPRTSPVVRIEVLESVVDLHGGPRPGTVLATGTMVAKAQLDATGAGAVDQRHHDAAAGAGSDRTPFRPFAMSGRDRHGRPLADPTSPGLESSVPPIRAGRGTMCTGPEHRGSRP